MAHTESFSRDVLSPEARQMVELASVVVCKERIGDPKGSVPIDDMRKGGPRYPCGSPEAGGAQRAPTFVTECPGTSYVMLVADVAGTTPERIRATA